MKDLKIYFIIACALLGLYLFIEYNKPHPIDWSPTFNRADKIPFGTYVLYHELHQLFEKGIHPSRQSMYETLDHAGRAEILTIAPTVNLSQTDYEQMCTYMAKGHAIFIAARQFNRSFLDTLNLAVSARDILFDQDSLSFHFVNPHLHPEQHYRFEKGLATTYFSELDTLKAEVLARNNKGDAIFVHYPVGKGGLYLLASPDFLSNYALLSPKGAQFASQALSYLHPKKPLIFDEYQALGRYGKQSVLQVIFSHEALKWGYYIILGCLVVFVLYESKRRQRSIPIADPMRNSSVDFVKVVSGVYYQQRDNKDIIQKKITYFLHFIRSNYRLKTADMDDEFQELLVARSGVQEEIVEAILEEIKAFYKGKYFSDTEIMAFNNHMEKFYEQSGIIWKRNFLNSERI